MRGRGAQRLGQVLGPHVHRARDEGCSRAERQRKRLELARAMATEPKLLLMDEVTGGVDQKTIPGLVALIQKMKASGVTIATIEHNINIIMEVSDHILALDQGQRIAFGQPRDIQNNEKVIDAYLGTVDVA